MKKWFSVAMVLLLGLWTAGCGQNGNEPEPATVALGLGESYVYSIDDGPFSSYVAGKVMEKERVGSRIEAVTLTAGWRNNTDGTMISQETLRGEVYAIKGISKDVAVALKFLDKGEALTTTHYYVIMDADADLSAVADYVIPPFVPNNAGDE